MSIVRENNTMRITFEDDTWKEGVESILSVTDGTTPFYTADTWQIDGVNTLRSGQIGNSGISETTLSVTLAEAGSIAFSYIVSSENNYDWLHVLVDGTEVLKKSGTGTSTFTEFTYDLAAGTHTIVLRYTKDGSQSSGKDACAIGYLLFTGVEPPYAKKYLLTDFNGKIYTLVDDTVTEITDAVTADLGEASFFQEKGFDTLPTSEQITSITKPVIYRWSDGTPKAMKAAVKAVPKKQTISCVADLSHETIHGITQMTAVYTGTVTVSYSFDGTNYTDAVDMATFLATDCATLYSSAQANKKIWFKFMIDGASSSLTNFVITYKND